MKYRQKQSLSNSDRNNPLGNRNEGRDGSMGQVASVHSSLETMDFPDIYRLRVCEVALLVTRKCFPIKTVGILVQQQLNRKGKIKFCPLEIIRKVGFPFQSTSLAFEGSENHIHIVIFVLLGSLRHTGIHTTEKFLLKTIISHKFPLYTEK